MSNVLGFSEDVLKDRLDRFDDSVMTGVAKVLVQFPNAIGDQFGENGTKAEIGYFDEAIATIKEAIVELSSEKKNDKGQVVISVDSEATEKLYRHRSHLGVLLIKKAVLEATLILFEPLEIPTKDLGAQDHSITPPAGGTTVAIIED